MKYINYH